MGRSRAEKAILRSQTLPSSPTRSFSSSSSDFEFNISSSPHNPNHSSAADDLFYKGKLLPLHLSPRLSMVQSLLLASSSSNSNITTTTSASRDSSGSSSSSELLNFSDYNFNCDSSRPSSVTEFDDEFIKLKHKAESTTKKSTSNNKYFSLAKISSVFKKNSAEPVSHNCSGAGSVKRMSFSAREVFKKYIKKVKPLYEKLSQSQKQKMDGPISTIRLVNRNRSNCDGSAKKEDVTVNAPHSFSGSLWFPKRKGVVSSCPSSMRTSPCHSGVLTKTGLPHPNRSCSSKDSSMEELQSAIQGAIAHCKNSMLQNRSGPLV